MSLLLEALKKAELAKQGTQPAAEPAAAALSDATLDFPRVDLTLGEPEPQPEPAAPDPVREAPAELAFEPSASRQPVFTRENLPDISQPLDIRTEDLGDPPPPPRVVEAPRPVVEPAAIERAPQPAAERAPLPEERFEPAASVDVDTEAEGREAARQMFEVKEVDYNPRRPFYFTVAGLVTAGACYAGYVWWQMQPHYAVVNTAAVKNPPPPPPAGTPATPAAAAPVTVPPANGTPATGAPATTVAAAPASTAPDAAPGTPKAGGKPDSVTAAPARGGDARTQAPRPRGAASETVEATPRAPRAPASSAASRPAPREGTTIAVNPAVAQVDPGVQRAYSLYQRGDWDGARADYQRVLERDATNRDALLGLAALDVRARSFETAELRYLRLLELNPRDSYALGALVALQGNVDAVQSESRIKTLIATQPEATHLYFTLGNLYSSQARWPEAQDAFFKAYSADPDNADYAFNLAVSLDQLRQRKPAAEFYRKAAALAAARPAGFDRARAEARARELER